MKKSNRLILGSH